MSTLGEIAVAMAEWIEHMVRGDNEDHSEILALCAAAREATSPERAGHVPVRIAVAVDSDGFWSARAWKGASPRELASWLDTDPRCLVWVTASVPLPQSVEVQGSVET